MKIGDVLKQIRLARGKNQVDLKKIISQHYLSKIESNEKEPTPDMLRKLCKYYGVLPGVVILKTTEEKDVKPAKREIFRKLKPAIDGLCDEILKP